MVYCGKPSKGCENCRLKRLKCDQKRPGCGQCRNTGRTCLGYRDANDLVFRDESQRITIKFQKKAEAQKATTIQTFPKDVTADRCCHKEAELTQRSASPKQLHVPQFIHQPIQDVAINFLLGDFLRGSHFDYISSLYNTNQTKDILSPTIKAVGLASLSLQTSRPELQDHAQQFYVEAIGSTNLALQRTDAACNDDLLVSILLLSLYETLSLRTHFSVEAWTAHMKGALTLVQMRGPAQFGSKFGLELFKQIAAGIRVVCVQRVLRIPQPLRDLTQMGKRHSHYNDIFFESPRIIEAFTDLRADIAEGLLSEPDDIIARAEDVLRLIADFEAKLPPDCLCDTVSVRSLFPEIHSDFYHKFKDHHVAQIWNTSWMAKLSLNTIIYEQILRLLGNRGGLQQSDIDLVRMMDECQQEIIEAAENICATVPPFFPPEGDQSFTRSSRTVAMGYFLIWPLFTAGASSLVPSSTRDFIIERLEYIANHVKLPQARKAAQMLAHGTRDESWMHLCHVF